MRAEDRRKDADWLSERRVRADSRVVPVWRDRNLIDDKEAAPGPPRHVLCSGDAAARLLDNGGEVVFLGMGEDRAVFAWTSLSVARNRRRPWPAEDRSWTSAVSDLPSTRPAPP